MKVEQNGNVGYLLGEFGTETTKLIVKSENGHVFSSDIDLIVDGVTLYSSEVTNIKRILFRGNSGYYAPVVGSYYPGGGFGPGYYGTLTTFESGPPERRRQYLATSIANDAGSTKDSILYDVTEKSIQLRLIHVIAPLSLTPNSYTVRYLYQPAAALPFQIDGVQFLLLDQLLGNPNDGRKIKMLPIVKLEENNDVTCSEMLSRQTQDWHAMRSAQSYLNP